MKKITLLLFVLWNITLIAQNKKDITLDDIWKNSTFRSETVSGISSMQDGRGSTQRLAPTGTFRQLTHMPWIYYKLYRRYFAEVRFRLVPMNLPPGGVYICRGAAPLAS